MKLGRLPYGRAVRGRRTCESGIGRPCVYLMRPGHEDIKRGKEALGRLSRSVDLETGLSALWQGRHRQENMLNHKWLDVSLYAATPGQEDVKRGQKDVRKTHQGCLL